MSKLFGANWWTTLWGFVTVLASAIALNPQSIAFLPESWHKTISGVAGLIALVAGSVFSVGVKSKNVTGGSVQQTLDGKPAQPGTQTLVDITKESPPQK